MRFCLSSYPEASERRLKKVEGSHIFLNQPKHEILQPAKPPDAGFRMMKFECDRVDAWASRGVYDQRSASRILMSKTYYYDMYDTKHYNIRNYPLNEPKT